jgi:hypothetical protein
LGKSRHEKTTPQADAKAHATCHQRNEPGCFNFHVYPHSRLLWEEKMISYYYVFSFVSGDTLASGHVIARTDADARDLATEFAAGLDATVTSLARVCECDLKTMRDAGLLDLEHLSESELLALCQAQQAANNSMLRQISKTVAKKRKEFAEIIPFQMDDHSDEPCYPVHRIVNNNDVFGEILNPLFTG